MLKRPDIRYDRQVRIPNWDQERLAQAHVTLIGSGPLAQLLGAGLAALGVGHLLIVDDEPLCERKGEKGPELGVGPGLLRLHRGDEELKAAALARMLSGINAEIEAEAFPMKILDEEFFGLLPLVEWPDLIIEATNDPDSQHATLRYAQSEKIAALFGAAGSTRGRMIVYHPAASAQISEEDYLLEDFQDQPQGIPSLVIAGLTLEEIRIVLMPLDGDDRPVEQALSYNLGSSVRFDSNEDLVLEQGNELSEAHCIIVGAGALGNWLGVSLALHSQGIRKLTVIDHDRVEETNLNRQILFYDCVGELKAGALARRLKKLAPELEIEALVGRAEDVLPGLISEEEPDLIFSCVDNFATRFFLSQVAMEKKIPLIDGATGPRAGHVAVYKPGITSPLDQHLNLERWAKAEAAEGVSRSSAGCAGAPEPSVVSTNMIIAGLMAAEAGPALNSSHDSILKGVIRYNSLAPVRIGVTPI